ncbi:MAG: hypothetical protein R2932_55490 [Caldilineaceae bacterium]
MGTIAQRLQVDVNLLFITGLLVGLLALTTIGYGLLRQRLCRCGQWRICKIGSRITFLWVMTIAYLLALLLSPRILILYIWFIAFLALKEFFSMTPSRRRNRVLFVAYLSLPINYPDPAWLAPGLCPLCADLGLSCLADGDGDHRGGARLLAGVEYNRLGDYNSLQSGLSGLSARLAGGGLSSGRWASDFSLCTRHGAAKPHHTIYLWPALR